MNLSNPIQFVLPLTVLRQTRKFKFQHKSNSVELAELTQILKIEELKAFSFQGQFTQINRNNYMLKASFRATLIQVCSVSLNPVKTIINQKICHSYSTKEKK